MTDPLRSSDDANLVAAVEAYAKAVAEGHRPDRQALLDAHPQMASELNACLDALELVHRFAPDVSDSLDRRTLPPDSAGRQPDGEVFRLATLGNFRLLRQIGQGGMGVVYEAQQIDLKRRVALKVLPFAAMLDRRQLTRFKNEAQAAAGLHHTNIVPVYSFGSQHGVHYYAMQYIEGQTLAQVIADFPDRTAAMPPSQERPLGAGEAAVPTETMDVPAARPSADPPADREVFAETRSDPVSRNATPPWLDESSWKSVAWCRRVAEMGIQVGEALEYAHQQGILHRDIKPSNLLLDVDGNVWITDFGLAQIETGTKLTLTGDVLGTLRYMSPEQAGGGSGRVDCRSDVYSLGITLYELLTLQPAFSNQRRELLLAHVLSEDSPPPPSRRNRSIPRDLETIVLKATAKIPADRYETAADLADDLRRFLAGRPIQARRPSPLDRLAKWTRRHAPIAVTTAAFTAVLAVSLLLLSILYAAREHEARVEAEEARRDSEAARIDAEAARRDAEDAQLGAETARMAAETVTRYLVDAFRSPDPQRDGQTITVAEVLDRTAAELQEQFADQPLVKASLLDALGQAYNGLGLYRQAESLYEEALELRQQELGREHPDTLTSMSHLAGNRISVGRYEDAVQLYEETFRLTREHLGAEHPITLESMDGLAASYRFAGRYDEAIRLHLQTLELLREHLGPEHSKTLHSMRNLAGTYRTAGRYDQAIRLNEETLDLCREHLGTGDPHTLFTMHNLAAAYLGAGRHRQAIPLLEETLGLFQAQFGAEHPHNLAPINNLAISYGAIGKYDEAVELHEKSLELHRAQLGPHHPDTLRAMHNLAATYRGPERSQEAIALHEQTVQLCRTHLGDEHPNTLNSLRSLIVGYQIVGRHLEASHLSEELVTRERKVRPDTSHHSRALALALTYLLLDQRNAEAEEYARECLAICQQQMPDDWLTFHTKVSLGRSLAGQKRYQEAELWLIDGYQGMIARRATIPPNLERRLTETLDVIILFYENRNKPEEAQRWRLVRDAQSDDPSKLIPSDVTDPEQIAARYLAWLDALPPDPKHGWNYPRSKLGRRIAESDELFARVIEARPDDHSLWSERGRMFALRSRWSEAVEAYRQTRRPGIPIETFELACALLLSGDPTGYRELCVELAAAPDEPADAVSAFHLAWITGIGPSGIEPDRIVAWTKPLVELEGRAWHLHALALAHYRAGDYASTLRICQQASALAWQADYLNQWLLAMTHARLGNPTEVGKACAEAERLAGPWMPWQPGGPAACLPPDWLSLNVLRLEAEDLLGIGGRDQQPRADEADQVAQRYVAWLETLPPDPETGWYHPRRALARQVAKSDDVFARVVESRPDDPQLWIERGRMLALHSRWSEAVEAYRRAPQQTIGLATLELAGALLLSGDRTGYRELCDELLADPDQPADSLAAFHLARIVSIGPSRVEPERAVAWAQRMVEEQGRAWHLHVLALAHYRAGDYVNTIRVSQQSEAAEPWPANFVNHWLLAIAHHRLDNPQGAVSARAEAKRLAAKWMPSEPGEAASCLPPDWLTLHILRAEAADLPNGDADTEAPQSDESSGVNPSGEPVPAHP